jgi:hypothetical protein
VKNMVDQMGVICLHGPVANVCPHCSSMNVVDDGLLDDVEVILNKDNTESIVTFEFEGDNYFMCFKCFDCGTHFCIDQNMMVSSDCYETC